MTSTVAAMPAETDVAPAFQDAIDIIGHELEATYTIITKTRQEIEELRNRHTLTDNIIKNLVCSSHGKPVFTCLAMQSL